MSQERAQVIAQQDEVSAEDVLLVSEERAQVIAQQDERSAQDASKQGGRERA
jgi:hypothetical protein